VLGTDLCLAKHPPERVDVSLTERQTDPQMLVVGQVLAGKEDDQVLVQQGADRSRVDRCATIQCITKIDVIDHGA